MSICRAYVEIDCGQLHYRRAGGASGVPLLLLHQSPSSSLMFEALMSLLADDFQLLAIDMPGFGNSDPLPAAMTTEALADSIFQALQVLAFPPCQVFGHHTGAAVAVQLAHDQPQQVLSLALSGPTLLSDELKRALPAKASYFPITEDGAHLQGMWQRMRAKEPDLPLALSLRETLFGLALGERYSESYRAVIEQPFAELLAACDCPVLVFAGTRDPLYSCLDAALACLQQGRKAEIEDAGSYVCELQTAQVAQLLRDFFLSETQSPERRHGS